MINLKFEDLKIGMEIITQYQTDKHLKCCSGKVTKIEDDKVTIQGQFPIKKEHILGVIENRFAIIMHDDGSGIHSIMFEDEYYNYVDDPYIDYQESRKIHYNTIFGTYSKSLEIAYKKIQEYDEIQESFKRN